MPVQTNTGSVLQGYFQLRRGAVAQAKPPTSGPRPELLPAAMRRAVGQARRDVLPGMMPSRIAVASAVGQPRLHQRGSNPRVSTTPIIDNAAVLAESNVPLATLTGHGGAWAGCTVHAF